MDRCGDCAFVYADLPTAAIPVSLRSLGPRARERLEATDAPLLRAHPLDGVWSALEYACHVRDVLQVQRERLEVALVEDVPTFVPMGREERVVRDRYNEQDPAVVANELDTNAQAIGAAFEALDDPQWQRTGIYTWPTTEERSMAWLGRHTVHEGEHHLRDIDHVLRAGDPPV